MILDNNTSHFSCLQESHAFFSGNVSLIVFILSFRVQQLFQTRTHYGSVAGHGTSILLILLNTLKKTEL